MRKWPYLSLTFLILINLSIDLWSQDQNRERLGSVNGYVYEYGTGVEITDAFVTLVDHYEAAGLSLTDENGYYEISGIEADIYDLYVYSPPYLLNTLSDLRISEDDNLNLDIELLWAEIDVEPDSYLVNVPSGSSIDLVMIITNDGCGELEYSFSYTYDIFREYSQEKDMQQYQPGEYAPALGKAPARVDHQLAAELHPITIIRDNQFFGVENNNEMFCYFDEGGPEILNYVGPSSSNCFSNAGTFDFYEPELVYELNEDNEFGYYNVNSGEYMFLGQIFPGEEETWTGICVDPTTGDWYGVTSDLVNSSLYLIDPDEMNAEFVGNTGQPGLIDICIDGNGDCWSYDIVTDVFVQIDKESGTGTVIGPLGFDANFGQGMTWDGLNDIIWLAAFNQSTMLGELRTVDTFTGSTMFWGILGGIDPGGSCQMGWISNSSFNEIQVYFSPDSGVVYPFGGQEMVMISIDCPGFDIGESFVIELHIKHNAIDPYSEDIIIPVTCIIIQTESCEQNEKIKTSFNDPLKLCVYPNPFRSGTTMKYMILNSEKQPKTCSEKEVVRLSIYNLKGQFVRTLVNEVKTPGRYEIFWDGRDQYGQKLPSGLYLSRIQLGAKSAIRKMVLVR